MANAASAAMLAKPWVQQVGEGGWGRVLHQGPGRCNVGAECGVGGRGAGGVCKVGVGGMKQGGGGCEILGQGACRREGGWAFARLGLGAFDGGGAVCQVGA